MKIRRQLTLISVFFLACALLLMSISYYVYISNTLTQKSEAMMANVLNTGALAIENLFAIRRLEVNGLSQNKLIVETVLDYESKADNLPPDYRPNYTKANDFLGEFNAQKVINNAFVLSSNGHVLADYKPNSIWLDLSDRQYFKDGMVGKTTITSLLTDRLDGKSVVFITAPIKDPTTDKIIGVMVNLMDTKQISISLRSLIDEKYGDAYLIDTSGTIAVHTDVSLVGTNHPNPDISNKLMVQSSTQETLLSYTFEGHTYYIVYKTIPDTPWTLVIEQNVDDFMGSAYQALWVMIGTLMIILVLAGLSFSRYAKIFTNPIKILSDVIHQTTEGDLSIRSDYVSSNELGQLSTDLNHMLDELTDAYQQLGAQNEELIATEEELRANYELLAENQTELKLNKQRIEQLAFTNALTLLPNRLAYTLAIQEKIDDPKIKGFTLIQLDIDSFARINYSLGQSFGDQVLRLLGKKINQFKGDSDMLFHLSADEFAFILTDIYTEYEVSSWLNALYDLLKEPISIDHKDIFLTMSIGVCLWPTDGASTELLLQRVETAMFEAKNRGKSIYVFYEKILSDKLHQHSKIENLLRRGIKDNLFFMIYQPQYNTDTHELIAFETLMRLQTEEGELIPPYDFIPIAEETGIIIDLGEWAIDNVLATMHEWINQGMQFSHVSINISGLQLKHINFINFVSTSTKKYKLKPEQIELEVTESIFIDLSSKDESAINTLKALGYRIALDDFGTGYSSFGYLRSIPLTTLKIDKIFVDDIVTSKKDQDLIKQMIELSHELGLMVVAEGVETEAQMDILKNCHCDIIQGYYLSKPLSLEDATLSLKR